MFPWGAADGNIEKNVQRQRQQQRQSSVNIRG